MKKILTIILSLTACANVAHATANRELCTPQSGDMRKGSLTTTCDWSHWRQSKDLDAVITLHGKRNVHAECELTGPDNMLMAVGKKHAKFMVVTNPGRHFGFDIGYDNYDDGSDNQNIDFYLDTIKPSMDDMLVCTFTTL